MFTLAFWAATAERAIKTAAQTAAGFFIVGTTGILDLDWATVGSVSGAAAVLSVLTSLASSGTGSSGPSLAGESLPVDARHRAE
jgi:hypothetical protein